MIEPDTLTLNVPIDIVGAPPRLVRRWRAAIDRAWNQGNDGTPFDVCGRTLHFNPQFTVRAVARPSPTSHLVVVEQVRSGEPFVSSVWHTVGTLPSYSPRTGHWGSNMGDGTAAHEFGHLLGLLDEYRPETGDRGARPERPHRPTPDVTRYADAPFSLMADERGVVLPRHLEEILRMHGAAAFLECR